MNGTGRHLRSAPPRRAAVPRGGKPKQTRAAGGRPVRRPAVRRSGGDPARRLGVTAAVAALVTMTAFAVAVLAVRPGAPRAATSAGVSPASASAPAGRSSAGKSGAGTSSAGTSSAGKSSSRKSAAASGVAKAYPAPTVRATAPPPASAAAVSLVLTAADRKGCPAAATACVDLARHITWLKSGGTVTFGPVQMEPGEPGSKHVTPRGTFHVSWKAGPDYISDIYHEAMPWATFFAAGGIAFHGGSLTTASHGCVHLTVANAHYYNENLPIGAEVVVF
jgi:lipoprotein-anchoring transpeptidase ErfK/SrfK